MSSPARILIVEDDEVLAGNLQTYLRRRASDVRVASDAASAMAILESYAPDLVLMDFALPGIDGLRAFADMVRFRPQLKRCVLMTGHLTRKVAETALRQGIKHLLCKPFSFAELQRLIDLPHGEAVPEIGE